MYCPCLLLCLVVVLQDGISPTLISRNPDAVARYVSDPLIYKGGTRARMGKELLECCDAVNQGLPNIKIPILLLHATADKVVPIKVTHT